ncbi:MAG: hypothetical protein ACYC2K_01680 [Gemmatimonadales bacterium]
MDNHDELNSQSAIARKTKVAQTSIGNMLYPEKRAPTKKGRLPSPTVENVEKVAKAFGKEAWQLLHPDPSTAPLNKNERAMYDKLMRSVQDLREITDPGSTPLPKITR